MPPFLKGLVTGALLATFAGGIVLWLGTMPKEPPPLIEKQFQSIRTPDSAAKFRAVLAIAFPSGSKASALRTALGRSGFTVDAAHHVAEFVTGGSVCSDRFAVTWKEGPGDILVSIDGGFSAVCL